MKNNPKDLPDNKDFIEQLSIMASDCSRIDQSRYDEYDLKRSLRDISGRGVMIGLTEISDVYAYNTIDGQYEPAPGHLYYRGFDINDLVAGFMNENRLGFSETTYLLLFGLLPDKKALDHFNHLISDLRSLPKGFVRDHMMKPLCGHIMNIMARSVLTLYNYDRDPDNTSFSNVLRQCLELVATMPLLAVYAYEAYAHYNLEESLVIHNPKPEYETAENILHMLRPNSQFTPLEARLLDLVLVLYAEHGGGNNSAFVTHVVTSSGTDTYATIAAALGALKGYRHGGCNAQVVRMIDDLKSNLTDWKDENAIEEYFKNLLYNKVFDGAGFIYGFGHAVYSLSDPRANQLKTWAKKLAEQKGMLEEYELYCTVERLVPNIIAKERKMYKGVSANIDFYAGFIFRMLEIPQELYTPLYAVARVVGWSAHRLEELRNQNKIIRPGYQCITPRHSYIPLQERTLE